MTHNVVRVYVAPRNAVIVLDKVISPPITSIDLTHNEGVSSNRHDCFSPNVSSCVEVQAVPALIATYYAKLDDTVR